MFMLAPKVASVFPVTASQVADTRAVVVGFAVVGTEHG
jgi:hypothetical protein